ncbi:hypothetical protein [Domibacillus antri]|uniref:hypothetical protein n=1 Tax=Domibacillus antri TaxID=1714264 RepID=UPI001FEB58AF|nr:hypothetical protein [Domibacillus antri]
MRRILIILLCLIYTFFMINLFIIYYSQGETEKTMISAGGIVSGLFPLLITIFTKIQFSLPLVSFYILFLFGSQYLGAISNWYGIEWWDTFLHAVSGVLLVFIGMALYDHAIPKSIGNAVSFWFIILFTVSFAVFGGTLWEVYEFAVDQLFGTAY